MSYETIETSKEEGAGVGVITLARPEQRNALSNTLMDELSAALDLFETDEEIGCIIITGKGGKAFAGGADIKEMAGKTFADAYKDDFITANWERVTTCRKPVIAAVAGYALGGGCELAMMCDMIIAADNAKFGQPEINLGLLPGAGGTQRLTRALGKAKAMDLCLTGRMMTADEADRTGLVSRVVGADELMEVTMTIAKNIAAKSRVTSLMIKEAVNATFETMLSQGVQLERRMFHAAFALEDAQEGMAAFIENRPPRFHNK